MVKAKKWVLESMFVGKAKLSDFRIEEEEVREDLVEGEILVEAMYLSVDPYVRVVKSKNPRFPVDALVLVLCGWRTHTLLNIPDGTDGEGLPVFDGLPHVQLLQGCEGIRPSLSLGMLGLMGLAAYFGLLLICDPKPGETVLVNAAAGAVGNVVGQIAKIKGCRVIGFTGTDEKCQWLKEIGFDGAYNYKKVDPDKALTEAAPDGIDCFFDSVGGQFTVTALQHMKLFGRVSICGVLSEYNENTPQTGTLPFMTILSKQLKVEGWSEERWSNRFDEGLKDLIKWTKEGKLVPKETITEGFENAPQAFCGMMEGENIGKALVKF